MDAVIAKIFAVGVALSQITTTPDSIRTHFDRDHDRGEVARLLNAGCGHMRKAFDVEDINLDDLIATAMDDPQALAGENRVFRGMDLNELLNAYRQFCKNETVPAAADLGKVIDVYNKAAADLPDHSKLKGIKLPGASMVLDRNGGRFAEVFEENARRIWITLDDVPEHVKMAFVAAEDQRFFEHKGIDERGLIRAFVGNLSASGRPQGGSTITQQVVKNLLVGDDLTFDRKIREMIVAARVERSLSKTEILELYLNTVYLGRGSRGIELAARSYFGKSAKQLTPAEGALLAGLTKGPNYYNPDRHPMRAQERLAYVLRRLHEQGVLGGDPPDRELPALPSLVAYEQPRRDIGFHFTDQVAREVKSAAGIEAITTSSFTVRSTVDHQLQRVVEESLQEGLSRYERNAGRVQFRGAEANLAQTVVRLEASKTSGDTRPAWQRAISAARLPLYDVHWTPAVVLQLPSGKRDGAWRVGLADGRILPLSLNNATARQMLKLHDVVFVHVTSGKGRAAARAELRVRPVVQGTVVVLENRTGRILAMTGGFSYPLSQLNRATQAARQPGSALKPLSYLAALGKGLQPNTLVNDEAITLPPLERGNVRDRDYWTPKNYDGSTGNSLTLRSALENSRNLATVRLLDGGIESKPAASLDRLCELAVEAKIYRECVRYYPFVLGAQPVRPVDLAAFYATIANEGLRPTPYVVESIEHNGQAIYRHEPRLEAIRSVDRAAFYQLKSMLQGVLARGTARSLAALAPYVAGKTGTSDDENDAWFVGFTNDVTVAVWIGYDNADGKRRTLGHGATGGSLAAPIFASVMQEVWAQVAPKSVLAPPSPEAKRELSCSSVPAGPDDAQSRRRNTTECLRVDARGRVLDTQYRLVARGSVFAKRVNRSDERTYRRVERVQRDLEPGPQWGWGWDWQPQRDWRGWRRTDPDHVWGNWR